MKDEIKPKAYPHRCVECGQKQVRPAVVRHALQKNHDGKLYDLVINDLPVNRCEACGELYFNNDSDKRISAALRDNLGLLSPGQIRANLEALKMQQKQLAERLGVAAETLSRWIGGAMIQSRAMDNLLRAYFGNPELRKQLTGENMDKTFGECVNLEDRAASWSLQGSQRSPRWMPSVEPSATASSEWENFEVLVAQHPEVSQAAARLCRAFFASTTKPETGECEFVRLVDELANTPIEVRGPLFEWIAGNIRSQKNTIGKLRPELAAALREPERPKP